MLWRDIYRRGDGSSESFERHAFDAFLAARPTVPCRLNHDNDTTLGNTGDGSLQLQADPWGLRLELTPYDTPSGRRVIALARSAQIRGASIRFDSQRSTIVRQGRHCCVLRSALREVSIIVAPKQPAYRASWISLWTTAAQERANLEQLRGYEEDLDELEAAL